MGIKKVESNCEQTQPGRSKFIVACNNKPVKHQPGDPLKQLMAFCRSHLIDFFLPAMVKFD